MAEFIFDITGLSEHPNGQGEDYQQPITFRRVSQSGQVELRIDT